MPSEGYLTLTNSIWPWIAAISAATFALTLWDKWQARRGAGRIAEMHLLLLALAGGSPGLVLGMLVARHKTRKPSFILGVVLVIVAQLALVYVWAR